LTIGPNGTVHATVKAREVVALGTIQGNVEAADRIEIRKDAKLVGDIRTARIVIEDGAYFKGSIDIVKPEPARATMPRQAQNAPPANASPAHAPVPAVADKR
jgi:cytoskeletal protein CcmA (bactofilin family)